MSIAERLGEIDLSSASTEKGTPKQAASLQTDNFAVLLVQGLESSDANILNVSVLWFHFKYSTEMSNQRFSWLSQDPLCQCESLYVFQSLIFLPLL